MRTLVLGAGGVGGYLAARMAERGRPPTLLLRGAVADVVELEGLRVRSPLGDWHGPVRVLRSGVASEPFDLIVLACKAYDLPAALDAVLPFTNNGTIVLPFLNGVRHMSMIADRLPKAHVIGGVAHIGATTDGPGCVVHFNALCTFLAGPVRGGSTLPDILNDLFAALNGPALETRTVTDASEAMWTKLVFLATLAAVTCLHRTTIGIVLAIAGGRETILATLEEARAVAAAEGFAPRPDDLARYTAQLTEADSGANASMLRDMTAGRATEAEHVLGDLCVRAERHSLSVPHLSAALRVLRAYEHERTATLAQIEGAAS